MITRYPSIVPVPVLLVAYLALGCGGGDDTEGDADTDTATDTETDTGMDTGTDTGTDTATDTVPDPGDDPVEDADVIDDVDDVMDSVTDTADDTVDDDGASATCDTTKMHSAGIAADPWGEGSFCDEVYACITSGTASSVTTIFPSATCGVTFSSCSSADACQVLTGGTITTSQWDDLCDLSLLSGVLAIYCIVYA